MGALGIDKLKWQVKQRVSRRVQSVVNRCKGDVLNDGMLEEVIGKGAGAWKFGGCSLKRCSMINVWLEHA